MTLLHWLLYSALPAAALTLLLVGLAGPRLLGLVFAAAALVPHLLLKALPPLPWVLVNTGGGRGEDWLLWGTVGAGLVGSLHDLRLWPRPLGMPPALAVVFAVPWFVLETQRRGWSFEQCLVHLSIGWAALAGVWFALRGAHGSGAGLGALLIGLVALAGDAVLLVGRNGPAAAFAPGGAAAVACAALFVATWRRPFVPGEGMCLPLAVVHTGVLLLAYHSGQLAMGQALLAVLAPAPIWLATRGEIDRDSAFGPPVYVALALAAAATFDVVAFVLGGR